MRRNLTGKTRAVIVMHYGGFPCRMTEILDIARAHDLRVVEDACHGPLSEYNGMKLGTLGDVGCFSFFSNKNISTGEGGMMVMRDASLYEKARLLRSHGMTTSSYQRAGGDATRYDVVDLGYNFRMDDMRAALGLVQLRKLKPDLEKRAAVRRWYLEGLERLDDVTVPFAEHTGYVSNYIMSVIVRDGGSDRRDAIREHLHKSGVQTSIHYPAVHRFSIYRDRGASVPVTEMAADHLVTLPMHSKLTKDDVDFVTAELGKALQV
jgi:dTDP-4-amino-4,6-dideoxygalactose transaminase